MTDGLLGGLGLEDVPDGLPDATYAGFVSDLKRIEKKDKSGHIMVMTYKVVDEGSPFNGETVDRVQSCNPHDSMQQKRFLKQMFTEIGVPENKLASVTKDDVIGTPVFFDVKKNNQYVNVTNVKLRNEANGQAVRAYEQQNGLPQAGTNPTTPPQQANADIASLL